VAKTKEGRAFANQLVGDHTKTSRQGKPLDQEANASIPPPDRSSAQQSMLQKLQGMIGLEFAKQYMDDRVSSLKMPCLYSNATERR
jgi:putative membrane protein